MKIVNVNVNVTVGLLIFLFFLVLCVPTTYIEIKAIVLMLVLMGVSTNILLGGLYISRDSLVAIISFSLIGLIYSFYGQINGNLGAFRVISIQVIWPLLYLYISTLARHKDSYRILFRVFLLSLIFTVVYTYIYLGHAAGLVPDYLYFALDLGQNVGFYDGFVEYELYSITSLIFLIPIVLHYSWDLFCLKKLTVFYFLLCLMSIVLVFLTGRKALWLVIAILPVIIFLVNRILGIKTLSYKSIFKVFFSPVWFSCVLFLIIFVSYFFYKIGLNLDTLWIYFSDGFDFDATESSSLRKLQYVSLMDGWYESSILFGAGNGANADVIRDVNMPWAYELTYVYILFTTGLVGVIFYSFWFLWGLLRLRISLNKNANVAKYLAPIVSGVFCILIAGATNPYFNKFDYLWIVLLPHLLSDSVSYVANNEDNIRCRGF